MGNKQEPAKSLRFHHGARHCVNVQSEVRKVLAFALYLVLNRVRWRQKPKDSFITNWIFEMLAAMRACLHKVHQQHSLDAKVAVIKTRGASLLLDVTQRK